MDRPMDRPMDKIHTGARVVRPQPRAPKWYSVRLRVCLPLRAKSSTVPHRTQANDASKARTGAHRSPNTESINRSWAPSSIKANA
jgi:hypothetical protein